MLNNIERVGLLRDFANGATIWLLPMGTTESDALGIAKVVGARVEVPAPGRFLLAIR
jgi:hypothetical protein